MNLPLLALAVIIGAGLSVQVGLNAQLRHDLGEPFLAALGNFLIGTLALVLVALAVRATVPTPAVLRAVPATHWMGGLLGATYVAVSIFLGPRLGSATLLALIVCGQLLMSLALDHYGLVGFSEHPLNAWRVVGGALLIAGVVMVVRN